MKIGIVGGGMTGLALAQRFIKRNHKICIFEKDAQLGGLATYHDYGAFFWDRFYHVILPSDRFLIDFINEIGLGDKLHWQKTLTGFFIDSKMYSISNSKEFLRFPPIGIVDKIRLALTILYCSRKKDWKSLENIPVENWLVRMCGRKAYEKMWKPLLLAKLGENYREVSAVFIWTYIARSYSARDSSSGQKEQLGHVTGGYKTVLERLENLLRSAGGQIHTGTAIERIAPSPGGGILLQYGGKQQRFDKVIFTGPVHALNKVAEKELTRVTGDSDTIRYLGVVCMVLVMKAPLVPYYVVNIADERIPFTGVIGMSNIVDIDETAGRYLVYLPKYLLSDDPFLHAPDEVVKERFLKGLRLMFPDLDFKSIESVHINRARRVQPLQVLNYSKIMPGVTTKHDDFFILNTAQFANVTLNNNSVIGHVNEFIKKYGDQFGKLEESTATEEAIQAVTY